MPLRDAHSAGSFRSHGFLEGVIVVIMPNPDQARPTTSRTSSITIVALEVASLAWEPAPRL